jgi:hypothetical protein
MIDAGTAIALMGNHEYNALAFHHPQAVDSYLRQHNCKHRVQHAQTLAQFFFHREEWQTYLEWFYTLPLFVELDGLRAVHACWDDDHINWLKAHNLQHLNPAFLEKAHIRNSLEYTVMDETLKGKEVGIPEEFAWKDKDGNLRRKNRIKWWIDLAVSPLFETALFDCPEPMRTQAIGRENFYTYPKSAPPVSIGHYWLTNKAPELQSSNVVCLDYSIAKEGMLVAYRWNTGEELNPENFVLVTGGCQ